MMKWTCNASFHVPSSSTLNVNAYSNYGCVNWCGCSFILHVLQPPTHCLQVGLATSHGLHVPSDIVPSSLPVGVRNTLSTELQSSVDVVWNSMSVCLLIIAKSTFSLFQPANLDSREIRILELIHHFLQKCSRP